MIRTEMPPKTNHNGKQTHEKVLNIVSYRGMQSKTTVRYYHTSASIAMVKKTSTPSGVRVEKWKLSYTTTRGLQSHKHFQKGLEIS